MTTCGINAKLANGLSLETMKERAANLRNAAGVAFMNGNRESAAVYWARAELAEMYAIKSSKLENSNGKDTSDRG